MIYKTKGTCTREIELEVEDGRVTYVNFIGGCDGNTKGLSRLVEGMEVDEVIHRLSGISCGLRKTSCPDQLSRALKAYKEKEPSTD